MKRIVTGLILTFFAVAFFACKDNDFEKQRENELKKLDEFIRSTYPELEPNATGLYYKELEQGTGDTIKIGDEVQIFFDMWTLDSTHVVGTGRYEPLEMRVQHPSNLSSSAEYIEQLRSLNEALTYMQTGTKSLLIFDSQLGFGQYGATGVGGFTPLMMEVEVYKVYPAEIPEEEEED
ncbi:FKBP-type peptidyl-prolyl cis-trans isomerase [Tangfeifania diversioriginum]|uniref:Peptidyl-prolyl cis-trans isomerase n=1 Tax=Tangfeifania diversioriginum TaxID=1168035 RepID=A0A1M6D2P6_9BACT|nr:FKBP-type peptidyl-prolyl cis-trans isomerase [Tangfeifania diversioriginum]SHI67565.1 FKBP-type peptidyl-prolyl cis-trans isomerase [Tangfeifania diversioriginum]